MQCSEAETATQISGELCARCWCYPCICDKKTDLMKSLDPRKSALSRQEGGDHYKNYPVQPIEYCHRNKLGPCETNIVKYATRWREKGGKQDLEKIKHYVDLLIELEGL